MALLLSYGRVAIVVLLFASCLQAQANQDSVAAVQHNKHGCYEDSKCETAYFYCSKGYIATSKTTCCLKVQCPAPPTPGSPLTPPRPRPSAESDSESDSDSSWTSSDESDSSSSAPEPEPEPEPASDTSDSASDSSDTESPSKPSSLSMSKKIGRKSIQ
mmetsp:Transcript_37844/g.72522  ORF Transcript_37844/g.72522 Transcript_37844/m.72522 type:complete len:159 (+) Transcript_37844:167-643(+)|eukprot:CAMPEP_0114250314 /NCGR_PEP_ID=MMETSP0058-20121206/14631_1 /TAXON_ID=36894 /ORGANISM="Pyramimonas parkeae, CCMP726" /LENGTH=158 /DNA_ID=CAMNT_0001363961 /DNA_START=307 /DNA_END=783 /DNA_ORIENTATION=-